MSVSPADEATFEQLVQRHGRERHVHCYRMLASYDEAGDAARETFLRARPGPGGTSGPCTTGGRSCARGLDGRGGGRRFRKGDVPARAAWTASRAVRWYGPGTIASRPTYAWTSPAPHRRGPEMGSYAEIGWLQPYPDHLWTGPLRIVGGEVAEITTFAADQRQANTDPVAASEF